MVPLPWVLVLQRAEPLPVALRDALADSLSAAERQRLDALRQPADRERFLLGRGALRRLLGAWLALPPAAVPIEVGPHGKPGCPGGPEFNLSHSGDLILLALHPSRPVGVDVEQARPDLDWRPIARRVLPPPPMPF
jgi:4'-phosphopantetheinyl transferase